jgi:signal transduction histidine kinase
MSLHVLVVDDILASRCAVAALVRELGHEAVEAASGREAVAYLATHHPDLVLLDLLMPDMDGFAVIRAVRAQSAGRWLPVIVTSALEGEEHFIHALEQGADDYLQRPVSPGLLRAKLQHYAEVLALQARLATGAQRQRDILDNILDPVLTFDDEGRIEELNLAALALTDPQGAALRVGDRCEAAFDHPLSALQHGQRVCGHRGAGQSFPAELGLSQWREEGQLHTTVVVRDLTEQQQVERMKDEFLATVSHELRTPLTSVLGALGLLAGGAAGELPAPVRTLAEVARRNGERLSRLVDDVLDLTKLEGDRLVLRPRIQPVLPLLREALAANQGYADRAGVRLQAEGLDGQPALQLRVDADRFLQALANLLSNAIKHSPAGEAVTLRLVVEPGTVRIAVRDRGPGIAPAFRARLFEKFAQAEGGDQRIQGGTGLGLHITRMLVERMGGRIAVESVAGEGAMFSLAFPCDTAGLATADAATLPIVMHVEADFERRARVAHWLGAAFRVEGFADLEQAQPPADTTQPVAWLANPQAQGQVDRFCHALRERAGAQPVLLYSDSIDQAYAERLGLRWLPIAGSNAASLREALHQALHWHRTKGTP